MYLSATQTLTIVLAGNVTANQLTGEFHYEDIPVSGDVQGIVKPLPGNALFVTNQTTAVTLVSSPAAGFVRKVIGGFVYNADTATATLTFTVTDSAASNRVIFKGTRATLENLNYTFGNGFKGQSVAMVSQ